MPNLVSRRTVLTTGLAAAATPILAKQSLSQSAQVAISSWGGSFQDGLRKVFFEPFTKETGINVIELTWGGQALARVRAQIQSGNVEADLLDGPPFWTGIGRRQGLIQPIDENSFVDRDAHLPGAITEFSYAYGSTTWGITYNTKAYPSGAPANWRDFWDANNVKARRSLFGGTPARHLEYALQADGLASSSVNPLDAEKAERAFRKLEEIKSKITIWYQSTAQFETLISSGEIDSGELTSNRVGFLKTQGAPLNFVFDGAVMNYLTWVMAKNAPNKANAIKFLQFCSRPDRQAEFAKLLYSGPTNKKSLSMINDNDLMAQLPTNPINLAKQVQLDPDWWATNLDSLTGRWNKLTSG